MRDESVHHNFKATLWHYYHEHGRHDLPWRQPAAIQNPYNIMLSELMLQQTQVGRVIPKYELFLHSFPTLHVLADADQAAVLRIWSGLGYNRRARFLHQAARLITHDYHGQFPTTHEGLVTLPGVGPNTAGAILAYAYNEPAVFIETNVRTVFLHHFFKDRTDVPDAAIRPLIEASMSKTQPREWYWALMDYGSWLKQTAGNANVRSKHYSKQSRFEGSRRQLRGAVLRNLIDHPLSLEEMQKAIPDQRLQSVLDDLMREGMIRQRQSTFYL